MTTNRIVSCSLLLAWLLIAVALTQATAHAKCENGTATQAEAMVERAVALVRVAGLENAARAFTDPNGEFLSGNLYVFVIDFKGTILINGALPRAIGGNALGARDSVGRFYVQEMIRIARDHGEGWVHYEFINPCSGRLSPKSSFVKRVDEILVGVGFYGAVVT